MKTPSDEWIRFVTAPDLGVEGLYAHFNKHHYERHAHDYFVLGTIDAGAPKVALSNRSFVAPAGTAMIINPGESHDGSPCDDSGYVYSMVYVEPWAITSIAQELGFTTQACPTFTHSVIEAPDIVSGLKALHRTLFSDTDPLARETRLIDAMVPLLERFSGSSVRELHTTFEPRIERVREQIHAEFSAPLTTTRLAQTASLSRVRLNQLFCAAYGLPLHAYLNRVRMDAARVLLRHGVPAAEVALAVGLADQSHLIRRFKGTFGITPAQFSAAHLSDIQYRR